MQAPSGVARSLSPLLLPQVELVYGEPTGIPDGDNLNLHYQCDCDCACMVISQQRAPALSGPLMVYLELTAACPNHCPGCGNVFADRSRRASSVNDHLSSRKWAELVAKLEPQVEMIRLTGGEPTAHPEFFAILQMLRAKGMPFALLTTGRWSEPVRLLQELRQCAHFQGFLISLHGPDRAGHEAFTAAKGSFKDAVRAIKLASGAGFDVATSTVLIKPNQSTVRETAELALASGAQQAIFGRFLGGHHRNLSLTDETLRRVCGQVEGLRQKGWPVKIGNCIPHCFTPSSATGCTAGETFCTVDPWGNVRPCNHAGDTAGNLLQHDLDAIWRSPTMEAWRQMTPAPCHGCPALAQCGGGCRAMYAAGGRDPLMNEAALPPRRAIQVPKLRLPARAIPQAHYRCRREAFGFALTGRGRFVPVSTSQHDFLGQVCGRYTLDEIEAAYGAESLSLIGLLVQKGLAQLGSDRNGQMQVG